MALRLSAEGAVAYVETDYFGGVGTQTAAAWRGAEEVMEPEVAAGAINRALREMSRKVQ